MTIHALANAAHRLLRPLPRGGGEGADCAPSLLLVLAYLCAGGACYGAVMGAFGLHGPRPLQMLYSALKVPLLLLASFALTLPSFFVINTLLGLRADFAAAVRALVSTQAALALVLAALAPLTALWYLSDGNYPHATLCNGVMFAIATASAQAPLRRRYQPLIRRHPRHRWMLSAWITLYIFIAIQMAWVLRPFIGDPERPTMFFRPEAWGNAYLVVGRLIWRVVAG